MPSERSSPSAGWRETYAAMDADTAAEETHPCPECGRESSELHPGVYVCDVHDVWTRATAAD